MMLGVSLTTPAYSQVGSSLQGTITDASGAVVPGVRLSITNLATNASRIVTTDQNGFYSIPDLAPANYQISASGIGFAKVEAEITLTVGAARVVNLRLPKNGEQQEIRITPSQGTANSSTGGVVNAETVRDLPANGRDWTQGATLQAGVSAVRTQPDANNTNSGRGQRGFGAQISVSGGRPQQNNYLLDGVSINDYANAAPGSVLGVDLGADAVEEFSVVTSNYPAEFGRSSGGVINAVTRGGSNDFHGSVYEFLRNSALDARNFFDTTKPPFRRNQFGASAGGPIQKNRTFVFGNYEGLRQSLGLTHVNTVLSPAARKGVLSTGNIAADPRVIPYLAFYPLPNRGILTPGDTGIFTFSGQQLTTENYVTTRLDHKFSERDTIFGTYVFDTAHTTNPDQLNTKLTEVQTRRQLLTLHQSHSFSPRALNALRFGFNRVVALLGQTPSAINPLAADTSLGTVPGHAAPAITVLGLTDFGGGLNAPSLFDFHWNSLQLFDDLMITHGVHSIKLGFTIERMRDNMLASSDPNGVFTFQSISDFLANRPYGLTVALPSAVSPRDLRQTLLGGYLQDDLRFSPNLTFNLGLRYEMATVPTESRDKLATLRSRTPAQPHLGDPYFTNPTLRNLEPRVGFSWDPRGNSRFTVRSGFGIFDVLPLPYQFELLSLFAAPFYQEDTATSLPPGSFPTTAFQTTSLGPRTLRNVYVQPDPPRNYVMQWNLNLEVAASKSLSALLGYVGSRGIHQPFRVDDTNIVIPVLTPRGYLWPSPPGSGVKMNPKVGRLDELVWGGDSYYDALQLQIRKAMGRGVQGQVSYTWGKSIDTGSATIAGDQFANSISSLPWFNPRLNRGLSDFNTAQTLAAHFTWDLPSPVTPFRAANWLASGWQLGGNYQASTGSPFTVVIGGDPLGLKSTDPYDVPNLLAGSGCNHPIQPGNPDNYLKLQCFAFPNPGTLRGNLGRNSIIGPGLSNFDMSLFKNNYIKAISEHFNAQFRMEVFNAFNRANFAPPLDHRAVFDQNGLAVPGAGLIDTTQTPAREIQFGLKLSW